MTIFITVKDPRKYRLKKKKKTAIILLERKCNFKTKRDYYYANVRIGEKNSSKGCNLKVTSMLYHIIHFNIV